MGIPGLWKEIGEGELVSIAELATDHYGRHGRPFRVAVDEAGWRFSNLTEAALKAIREKEPAANTIEKTIMYRILNLMMRNIQMIFVFDGPRRPWKRNRQGGNKVDYGRTRLLRQVLDHLKIPHHEAPGEAEAECAAMQQLGIVDAVWTDDSDALMFGATCIVRAHKTGPQWSKDKVYVHRQDKILSDYDLDPESFVLFAMLAGGDYDPKGLPGCGPKTAMLLSRKQHGIAHALCRASAYELSVWRALLEEAMLSQGIRKQIPSNFPDQKALKYSCHPTISTFEQLHNLRGLRNGWHRRIDQPKLRVLFREEFNFSTKNFIKNLAPVFMVQHLASTTPQDKAALAARYDIQLKTTRKEQAGSADDAEFERKVTFYPLPAIEIDISTAPDDENWSTMGEKGSRYDPGARIECTLSNCLLQGLSEESLANLEPLVQPRNQNGNRRLPASDPNTRMGTSHRAFIVSPSQPIEVDHASRETAPRKSGRTRKETATTQAESVISQPAPKKRGRPSKDATAASPAQSAKKPKEIRDVVDLCESPTPPPPESYLKYLPTLPTEIPAIDLTYLP